MRAIYRVSFVSSLSSVATLAAAMIPSPTSGQRAPADDTPVDEGPSVIAVMRGLRNDRGVASAGLYDSSATWTHSGREVATCDAPIVNGVSRCRLEDVRPGRYAIAVMHDEDDDGHFDTGFLGLPSEGYGFSRDVRGSFGPPSFDSASFEYPGGVVPVTITMRYGI